MVDVEWLQRINYSSSTCMTRGEGADDLWLLWVPHSTVEGTMGPSQDRRGGEATNAKGNGEVHMHVGRGEGAGGFWVLMVERFQLGFKRGTVGLGFNQGSSHPRRQEARGERVHAVTRL